MAALWLPSPTWRTHSCVQRSHSCERVFFCEIIQGRIAPYSSGHDAPAPAHLPARPLALRHVAPIWQPSPRPLSAAPQVVCRAGLRLDGSLRRPGSDGAAVPQARTNRPAGYHLAVQRGGSPSLQARGFRCDGQPRSRALVASRPGESPAEVAQRCNRKRGERRARTDWSAVLATRVVRSLGSRRSGVGQDCGLYRGESCEGGGFENRAGVSVVERERGVAGTRSHECERCTHECVRHGLTTNRLKGLMGSKGPKGLERSEGSKGLKGLERSERLKGSKGLGRSEWPKGSKVLKGAVTN
jgi:hypothetical protein